MIVLGYGVAPANVHDSRAFKPAASDMTRSGAMKLVREMYGDSAYDSRENREYLRDRGISVQFHTRAESGKHPASPRTARRKSKIRARVESIFGILCENYAFGRTRVRTLPRVAIDLGLVFTAWNFFYLMAYIDERFEYKISVRGLMYGK
jgi:hypothetical protein